MGGFTWGENISFRCLKTICIKPNVVEVCAQCRLCWAALLDGTQHNFRVMEVILHRFIKSAHVDSIHDSMMPLYA